jgi:hypothetical protein
MLSGIHLHTRNKDVTDAFIRSNILRLEVWLNWWSAWLEVIYSYLLFFLMANDR